MKRGEPALTRILGWSLLTVCLAAMSTSACSGVVIVGAGRVIAAGNEDNTKEDASMWATAASDTGYGAVYFGFYFSQLGNRLGGWYEMQGINDQGLYYDLFSVPCDPNQSQPQAPTLPSLGGRGRPEAIERTMMTTCATVAEALAFLHGKNYASILPCVQTLLVDREGNAAVYTGGRDIFRTTPGFVVTNFRLDAPEMGEWPCDRYSAATSMLAWDASPTLERAAQVLRTVRYIPGPYESGGTRYSIVCDLVSGIADVYIDGDFTKRARLDLTALWSGGLDRVLLADLEFGPSDLP
jgi:hypothetical protein